MPSKGKAEVVERTIRDTQGFKRAHKGTKDLARVQSYLTGLGEFYNVAYVSTKQSRKAEI